MLLRTWCLLCVAACICPFRPSLSMRMSSQPFQIHLQKQYNTSRAPVTQSQFFENALGLFPGGNFHLDYDKWLAVKNCGLFSDLTANISISGDNEAEISIFGKELPCISIRPDVSIGSNDQGIEVLGGVCVHHRNVFGLGQELLVSYTESNESPSSEIRWRDNSIGKKSKIELAIEDRGSRTSPDLIGTSFVARCSRTFSRGLVSAIVGFEPSLSRLNDPGGQSVSSRLAAVKSTVRVNVPAIPGYSSVKSAVRLNHVRGYRWKEGISKQFDRVFAQLTSSMTLPLLFASHFRPYGCIDLSWMRSGGAGRVDGLHSSNLASDCIVRGLRLTSSSTMIDFFRSLKMDLLIPLDVVSCGIFVDLGSFKSTISDSVQSSASIGASLRYHGLKVELAKPHGQTAKFLFGVDSDSFLTST